MYVPLSVGSIVHCVHRGKEGYVYLSRPSVACVLSRLSRGNDDNLPSFLCAPTPNVAVTEVDGDGEWKQGLV